MEVRGQIHAPVALPPMWDYRVDLVDVEKRKILPGPEHRLSSPWSVGIPTELSRVAFQNQVSELFACHLLDGRMAHIQNWRLRSYLVLNNSPPEQLPTLSTVRGESCTWGPTQKVPPCAQHGEEEKSYSYIMRYFIQPEGRRLDSRWAHWTFQLT
jgi:hypothetical protein